MICLHTHSRVRERVCLWVPVMSQPNESHSIVQCSFDGHNDYNHRYGVCERLFSGTTPDFGAANIICYQWHCFTLLMILISHSLYFAIYRLRISFHLFSNTEHRYRLSPSLDLLFFIVCDFCSCCCRWSPFESVSPTQLPFSFCAECAPSSSGCVCVCDIRRWSQVEPF